ncbi:MAG: ABC transporter permease subunit, partial [Pseudomonadota bacterium]
MSAPAALRPSLGLRALTAGGVALWCLLAAFPIFWIGIMSFKSPVDAFAADPLDVVLGPETRAGGAGLSAIDLLLGAATLYGLYRLAARGVPAAAARWSPPGRLWLGWILAGLGFALAALIALVALLPLAAGALNAVAGPLGAPILGATAEHYVSVWVDNQFWRNFANSLLVTAGVVTVSLTVGTLAGYGLARSGSALAFWILIIALIFRALPHSVLVAGYLPVFINSAELLSPILGDAAPTLYGQPWAVIAVLVSINQPFTIWMLRSFFQSIPAELDEAARVDGCTHLQAFRWVIMPVM